MYGRAPAPALPCVKNAAWFSDRDVTRIGHEHDWGATRWYASVMLDGVVSVGDPIEVEPDVATARS